MRRYLTLLALAAALLWTAAARAADVSLAVLGVQAVDVPESLAQSLTDALRQRASATTGLRLVPGKDLIEVKMVFGCDGELPACMANAGKALGADKLLYGTLKKGSSKSNVTVTLKLLDVKTAVVEKFVNDTVAKRELAGSNVNGTAARWFGQLIEIEAKPVLTVSSDPTGANVSVDGQAMGRTPVTLRDLSAGPHTVVLSMEGRKSATRNVELRPGGTHEVVATLEPEAPVVAQHEPPPPPPEPVPLPPPAQPQPEPLKPTAEHPGRTAQIVGGGLFGLGVAGVVATIVVWSRWDQSAFGNNTYEGRANADLTALQPYAMTMDEKSFISDPKGSCNPPATLAGNSPAAAPLVQHFHDQCQSGKSYADATTGLIVTSSLLGGAGIVAFVIGEIQAHKAKERQHGELGLMRQSLRIAPIFTTTGGGLTAKFEF